MLLVTHSWMQNFKTLGQPTHAKPVTCPPHHPQAIKFAAHRSEMTPYIKVGDEGGIKVLWRVQSYYISLSWLHAKV